MSWDGHIHITAEELRFGAKLQEYIDKQRAKWEAQDIRSKKPPTERQLEDRLLWETMVEENAWEDFYGPEVK
jgi:hypothetical protein